MGTKIVNLNFSIFSELEFVSSETQFSKLSIYFDKKTPVKFMHISLVQFKEKTWEKFEIITWVTRYYLFIANSSIMGGRR